MIDILKLVIREPKTDKYLEDDGKFHRKLTDVLDLYTETEQVEDDEEVRMLIMHERLLMA